MMYFNHFHSLERECSPTRNLSLKRMKLPNYRTKRFNAMGRMCILVLVGLSTATTLDGNENVASESTHLTSPGSSLAQMESTQVRIRMLWTLGVADRPGRFLHASRIPCL